MIPVKIAKVIAHMQTTLTALCMHSECIKRIIIQNESSVKAMAGLPQTTPKKNSLEMH